MKTNRASYQNAFTVREDNIIEALVAPFNIRSADRRNLVFRENAFDKLLAGTQKRKTRFLRDHDDTKVLGFVQKFEKREDGLYAFANPNLDVQLARETVSLLRDGSLDSVSAGWRSHKEERVKASDGAVEIHQLDCELLEFSIVSIPAFIDAKVLSASLDDYDLLELIKEKLYLAESRFARGEVKLSDIEKSLRDLGLTSNSEATNFANSLKIDERFKSVNDLWEARKAHEEQELKTRELQEKLNNFIKLLG